MPDFPGTNEEDAVLLEAARRAAEAAAEVHRENAPDPSGADWAEKGRADFVTGVDREAERRVVRTLLGRFPDHGVLAEEAAETRGGAWLRDPEAGGTDAPEPASGESGGRTRSGGTGERPGGAGSAGAGPGAADGDDVPPVRWIVDPLDGTTNWLHGYPEYAVSIAAVDDGGLRAAVVLNSATGERFEAVRGAGARRDGEPIRVSATAGLELALVGTGFPFKKPGAIDGYLAALGRTLRATSGVRRAGAAALDLCALACGRLDAFFEFWLMPWDVAAGALIVHEAGGVFRPIEAPGVETGPGVDPAAPELRPGAYAAANGRLMEAFLPVVRGEAGAGG